MDAILAHIHSLLPDITARIQEFVECESPSDNPAAVNRFVELVADRAAPFARTRTVGGGKFGPQLLCEMNLPGAKKSGQILVLGHSDTVWPMGTLKNMPFRQADG